MTFEDRVHHGAHMFRSQRLQVDDFRRPGAAPACQETRQPLVFLEILDPRCQQ